MPSSLPRPLRLPLAGAAALAVAAISASCLEERAPNPLPINPCTRCHGSDERQGTRELQAAPPFDTAGNTDVAFPGVGSHQQHLVGSITHGPVACAECHIVPEASDSPGHVDSAAPAELAPGPVARQGGRKPSYDPIAFRCAHTYCHGSDEPRWTAPRSSAQACGSCHGLPPPAPHPADVHCERCHDEVMQAGLSFAAPARHVDGAIDSASACGACHGTKESYAPPPDLSGSEAAAGMGVGAHQIHATGGASSRPVACESCHLVPAAVSDPGHLDGSAHAEVAFGAVAVTADRQPVWSREQARCAGGWCHGPTSADDPPSPIWTSAPAEPLPCDGCHGMPPPAPHAPSPKCTVCHGEVVEGEPGNVTIKDRDKHVDGVVQSL
ncbi:MAG: hypothetical protein HY744_24595 [Deltaproteobacteria bacterium]|nr:hypothetical protein [Deltaproteobacteria bacterium]